MEPLLTQLEGLYFLIGFALVMITLVWFKTKKERHADGFLVADRKVSTWGGAFSIAVSWIWAPAVFVCSLQAYTKGLPGVFWFVVPNILCFFTFAFVAVRLRKLLPDGYTLPEFMWYRFKEHKGVHVLFLIIAFSYQLGAIIINSVMGGALLHLVSGIDIQIAMLGMVVVALAYSLLSGLKASIFTDIIQMSMILVIGFILVPLCIIEAGGLSSVSNGFAGISGEFGSLFNAKIAWLMGVPMTITLISGPIGDQIFYQRAMSVNKDKIVAVFVRGGLLFGLVPIILSLFGFIAVTLVNTSGFTVDDPQLVGALVVGELLPKWGLYLFTLMAFAGLCSTLDSAFCAISSLGSVDIYRRYFNLKPTDKQLLFMARIFMVVLAIAGAGLALLEPKLLWIFFIQGVITAIGLFPTVFALFWRRISAKAVFVSIIISLLLVTPLNIYANISENENLVVISSISGVSIGLIICLLGGWFFPDNRFKFMEFKKHEQVIK